MNTQKFSRKGNWVTIGLIVLVLVIAAFPMFFNLGDPAVEEAFGGTDAAAESIIVEQDPDYEPWFDPIVGELPGEVESGLFALQAALGAGALGYVLGVYRGRRKAEQRQAQAAETREEDAF
ncbi:energy-coupling factor ABC transporter substrate-binding protein [Corynebacterium sp. SCR221107]|uniref:energy-coupling factor ABC transporter substrate-binding protein n=1 Tax=Corynebacterium sp. SCR221107 TaxID=3017361 RepID=UPI0022EC24D1|nr:energy-coupling factor ABC transporter substrate-binding protein [Corynebacterium sp. SCR221107]WBT09495.1 energy-coupling factor ABC transporter substrate-binding protein [Corynebacterium sp. SCR221107]